MISAFVLGGPHHDTISLPDSAASRLGAILAHATTDAQRDTTLHLDKTDTITIAGSARQSLICPPSVPRSL